MGARANYVIIREGKVSAYYEHWGADGVRDSVFDGPEECARMATTNEDVDELMDRAFCEGGYLLDFDRKMALFFGYGEVSPSLIDAISHGRSGVEDDREDVAEKLDELRRLWSGWQVRFARSGVDDVSLYLEKTKLTGQIKVQPRRSLTPSPPKPPEPPQPAKRHGKRRSR